MVTRLSASAALPQSERQTAPHLGGHSSSSSHRGHLVHQRSAATSSLSGPEAQGGRCLIRFLTNSCYFCDWQSFELGEHFCCGSAHAENYNGFWRRMSRCGDHSSLVMSWPFRSASRVAQPEKIRLRTYPGASYLLFSPRRPNRFGGTSNGKRMSDSRHSADHHTTKLVATAIATFVSTDKFIILPSIMAATLRDRPF